VVTIDPDVWKIGWKSCYNIAGGTIKAECRRLATDIDSLKEGTFVLVAVKGTGTQDLNQTAIEALKDIGASYAGLGKEEVGYALIGCKGYNAPAERHGKKAEAEAAVSFSKAQRGEKLPDSDDEKA